MELTQTKSPHTGERIYVDEKGRRYPSVSRLAGFFWSTYSIHKWKQTVGKEEAQRIMRESAKRGTAIHKAIETNTWTGVEEYDQYLRTYRNTVASDIEFLHHELTLAHVTEQGHRFAGKTDSIANWIGKLTVDDFKTSEKPKKLEYMGGHALQLSAYSIAYGEPIDEGIIFNLTPDSVYVFTIPLELPKAMLLDQVLPNFYDYYRIPKEERPYANQFNGMGRLLDSYQKELAKMIVVKEFS
jgi:hypothetical protein